MCRLVWFLFSLSLFCFANGETLIEAIENRKHNRYKKELLHAYVMVRIEAIFSLSLFCFAKKVTKKGDLKRMAPPFLGAGRWCGL